MASGHRAYDSDERSLLLLRQLAEAVRHEAPVDVSDPGAGHPHDTAAALPDLTTAGGER